MILDERQMWDMMNSDMRLWDSAHTKVEGSDVTKTLTLPLGIGEVKVQFQGVDSGIKRRAAAEQWGAIVRERIRDRTDDDAITARAQQAAAIREAEAEAEEVGGADSADSSGGQRTTGESSGGAQTDSGTVQAHAKDGEDDGPGGTDFVARGEWLRGRIEQAEANLTKWRKELRAIDAALEILNGGDDD